MSDVTEWTARRVAHRIDERANNQRRETEGYLRREIVDGYDRRRRELWDREYPSIGAYRDSVALYREHWRAVMGVDAFGPPATDPDPTTEPFLDDDAVTAEWLGVRPFADTPLRARGILARPSDAGPGRPHPLVICAHGAESSLERVFGFDDPAGIYHGFRRRLVEAG